MGRSHRDCILEWARLFPEKISQFLDRMATDPGWQIAFRGLYDCLRLLYLRLFNKEARIIEMMESQFTHRIEMMLAKERVCLERHKEELAVRQAWVLYLESITSENAAFKERTEWRKKLPSLPRWPSRRKANKRKPRGTASCVEEGESAPKRMAPLGARLQGCLHMGQCRTNQEELP